MNNNHRHEATAFVRYFWQKCARDNLLVSAGYLAYLTSLSIVPLITVMLSVLSAFSDFELINQKIEGFIFQNFMPASGEVVQNYIREFVSNASKLTSIGVIFLIAVSLMLIRSIEKTLNQIWETDNTRDALQSLSLYWLLLTLGPLLMGSGMAITSYILSRTLFLNDSLAILESQFLKALPLLTTLGAFLMIYLFVPAKKINFRQAILGALIAASLFELSKKLFSLYILYFPTYEAIYGVLSSIPLLLIWIYIAWVVLLIGAEIAASLSLFEHHSDACNGSDCDESDSEHMQASEQDENFLLSKKADF